MLDQLDRLDLSWLAGLLEGEGTFLKGSPSRPGHCKIVLVMTDEDVVQRAAILMGAKAVRVNEKRYEENGWKIPFRAVVSGGRAIELMTKLRPLMGTRRQSQIDLALKSGKAKKYVTASLIQQVIEAIKTTSLTQGQIAQNLGLRRETVNKIWRGKRNYGGYSSVGRASDCGSEGR